MSYSLQQYVRTPFCLLFAFAFGAVLLAGESTRRKDAATTKVKLTDLAEPMPEPGSSDWLANHDEPGQSLYQYLHSDPIRISRQRKIIYLQPLGTFTKPQQEIVDLTQEYMALYFGCEVKMRPAISLDKIPAHARRFREELQAEQLLTTYIIDSLLLPHRPNDAAAVLCITATDLYPKESWNFVYGQARIYQRVGVWSIARNGNPVTDKTLCLRRTLKTATHETGHMFSMLHCTAYRCNMNGSNNRYESDSQPLYCCPLCSGKVIYATGQDSLARAKNLYLFSKKYGLQEPALYYEKAIKLLGGELPEAPTQANIRQGVRSAPVSTDAGQPETPSPTDDAESVEKKEGVDEWDGFESK